VYEPGHDHWLLERAKKDTSAYGLELHAEPAANVMQGAERYGHLVQIAEPHTDAIWLTLNNVIIDDHSLVPYLIEQAWYRKVIIVSNKLEHARWGVLFATYPNNRALGQRLAETALTLTRLRLRPTRCKKAPVVPRNGVYWKHPQ
jgi:putative tryptophan/tyrosine transport system substrate-binding protein